jgi:hypothetical protein
MNMSDFPLSVWDGVTRNRTRLDDYQRPSPDDMLEIIDEIIAAQRSIKGGASIDLPVDSDGQIEILPAVAYDRYVIVSGKVTEDLTDGSGSQPIFDIGYEGAEDEFLVWGDSLVDATEGTSFSAGGLLPAGKALSCDATAGNDSASTGAIRLTVLSQPA